jgi:4-diphosphocytidyl-2-C-methyl-D-erythritol kinase
MDGSAYKIHTPAKVNIRLKITGRRSDGFHELESIMVPIDVTDSLEMRLLQKDRIEISSHGYDVPNNETNLACRAARAFFNKIGVDHGVSIKLMKNIPVAAGLGGGSSDAAATLLLLNDMHGGPLSVSELHEMAVGLGADVPFFLYGRPSLARGIGDILEPIHEWPVFWYVIITPPIKVSTAWVYENYRLELTTNEYDFIVNLLKSSPFAVSRMLENDLERVTAARFPIINTLKQLLLDADAEGAVMSGSGSSVFGLFLTRNQAVSAKDTIQTHRLGDVLMAKGWETAAHNVQ